MKIPTIRVNHKMMPMSFQLHNTIYPHSCHLETKESQDPYNIVILETCISGRSHKNNPIVTEKRHETRTSDWLMRAVKCLDGRTLSRKSYDGHPPVTLDFNLSTTVDHFTQAVNNAANAKRFEDPDGCSHFPSSSSPSSSSSWSSSSSSESSSSFFPCQ